MVGDTLVEVLVATYFPTFQIGACCLVAVSITCVKLESIGRFLDHIIDKNVFLSTFHVVGRREFFTTPSTRPYHYVKRKKVDFIEKRVSKLKKNSFIKTTKAVNDAVKAIKYCNMKCCFQMSLEHLDRQVKIEVAGLR